jgi:hypothetical protein
LKKDSSGVGYYSTDEKAGPASGHWRWLVLTDLLESVDDGTVLKRANFILTISVQNIAFAGFPFSC